MKNSDYPSLYQAANTCSINSQKSYLFWIKTYLVLLIISSGFSIYLSNGKVAGIIAAFLLLCTIGILIFQAYKRFDVTWYNGRAVSESIKTRTWRFMMRAEPYVDNENIDIVKKEYVNDLNEILIQNKSLGDSLLDESSITGETVTSVMLAVRKSTINERLAYYVENRIDEQRKWYAIKASFNKVHAKRWYFALIATHLIAIILILIQIACDTLNTLPTELFIVAASSILTWIQVKKYQDLSTAYTLTAHEIGLIREQSAFVKTEQDLSDFVKDSENAFSREHTQWIARKDK